MNYSLLLSEEEYQAEFQKGYSTPYTFEITGKNQVIFYFGAKHSHNPQDDQWQKLEEYWSRFLRESLKKKIILLESPGEYNLDDLSREETINRFGETGFLIRLAKPENVPFIWPDLSIKREADILMSKFEPDLVRYFIFARSAGSWLQTGKTGSFDEIIDKAAQTTAARVTGAPSDLSFYVEAHRRIFNRDLTPNEKETLIKAAAPVYHDSIINDIARASSRLRNERIVSEVERFWTAGNSIFILFGAAHAIIQEKALKSLVLGG